MSTQHLTTPVAAARRSRAVRDAFVTGAGAKVGALAAQLVALGIAARALGAEDLGVLVTVTAVSGILGFLDLGIGNAAIGEFARLHSTDRLNELRRAVAGALGAMTGLALVIGLLSVAALPLLPAGEARWAVLAFLLLSAAAIPASLGSRLALGVQRGRQNNLVMLLSSLAVLGGAWAAGATHAGLVVQVVVFIGLPVLGNAVQTTLLLARGHTPIWEGVTLRGLARLIVPGLPFTGLALAGAAAYQTDALIILSVLGPAAAVGFGLLTRMFSGLTVLFMGGLQQLWASTAHALAVGDGPWVRSAFRRTLTITLGLYVVADVVLVLAAPWIVRVWSNGQAEVGVAVVLAFVVWNTYNFGMSQCSMLLNGAGVVGRQALVALAMAAVNIPLSILLTHLWGLPGPLWASLIAHAFIVGIPTAVWASRVLRFGSIRPVAADVPAATAAAGTEQYQTEARARR